ncbi:hypothetical protein WJR50_11675 [Catalinimonas sp. 4WD22]|uniref:hypothetical protein n=1 Tax=Catalinimonas locisalis TaxID=3133978 RepID=UPI0031015BBF
MRPINILYILSFLLFISACSEEDSIRMPDYEVGIIAQADIAPDKYFFNADQLETTEIEFDLNYEGFDTHQAESIELFISNGPQTVSLGSFNSFPSTLTISAEEAYSYFGESIEDFDDDGSGRDEFQFTYSITTTDGTEYSEYGQYYTYNPSLDGRFTGRYAQFYTNLPGFGVLIFDVRPPNPAYPNEN